MLILLYSLVLNLAQAQARCYPLSRPDAEGMKREMWCYENRVDGKLRIFNVDEGVRPELALTVDANGMITHGSLTAGHVSLHRVYREDFNPFALPLSEPIMLAPSSLQVSPARMDQANALFDQMEDEALLVARPFLEFIHEGILSARSESLPWRGTSWSFKNGQLFEGWDAPTAKFDRFIHKREGIHPGLQAWETSHHGAGYWWGGHCNGWAVSAILREEPREPLFDQRSGIVFKVSHLKGLLAAKDYCAKIAMFGHRNYGREAPRSDIDPALFHKTLLYYVGELKKPLAMDYRADEVVDTHVITGYDIHIFRTSPGVWRVGTRLKMHRYDRRASERLGMATNYHRDYVYDLFVDAQGKITGGVWVSENPDFVYSPLGSSYCPRRHPGLTEERLQAIFALPKVR